jgi:lysophospholipase L1-like esterase
MFPRRIVRALNRAACAWLAAALALCAGVGASAEESPRELLDRSRRIVFLGDSITASGQYVAWFDAWLVSLRLPVEPLVIDAGLASETVSGLSEPGHAGGKFPRPDLFERLDRVLDLTKPDLVFACYGMNCGIYQPFDAERFERYQAGMLRLEARVRDVGARFIAISPPLFDDQHKPREFSYNAVLDRYSQWLVAQRASAWRVIDLHTAMNEAIARGRTIDPKFTFEPDGVHPNDAGHWLMAQTLIAWFGDAAAAAASDPAAMLAVRHLPAELLKPVRERTNLLRDAYVAAAGHKRPGAAKGLPLDEANARAEKLSREIRGLLDNR